MTKPHRVASDTPFFIGLGILGSVYIALIVAMLAADVLRSSPSALFAALADEHIQYSIQFTLVSATISAIISLWIAVPLAYGMSRFSFRGRALIHALIDIPILLPPLVIGISLFLLCDYLPSWLSREILFSQPAVIIAQVTVACAFAVRSLSVTFDQIPQRYEEVAMCLGCNRSQAFWQVVMPQARNGVVTAFMLAWARSFGEFGPILVFAGATRMHTEVLSTSIFLELQSGQMEAVTAVALIMVCTSLLVLTVTRVCGMTDARGAL